MVIEVRIFAVRKECREAQSVATFLYSKQERSVQRKYFFLEPTFLLSKEAKIQMRRATQQQKKELMRDYCDLSLI